MSEVNRAPIIQRVNLRWLACPNDQGSHPFSKRDSEMTKATHNYDRRHFIGGSDARVIMSKDEKALLRLWKEKRGEVANLDLSGVLIVQLGLVTEDLNSRWYELKSRPRVPDI